MTIRYPNGRAYAVKKDTVSQTKTVKAKALSYSNRGKTLEDDLNETNQFYLTHQIANIHKKPVPIQIVKVEYPKRSAAVIKEAYFRTPSTTDYNGVWNGHYIDFEAKETESKTSFPLKNIHPHQIEHMEQVITQKGIAFFIIRFSSLGKNFVSPYSLIKQAWDEMEKGGRKSIPLALFEQHAYPISLGFSPRMDYLQAVKQLLSL